MAAKKAKKSKRPAPSKQVNKSAFIRQHANLGVAELIKLGKSRGIELSAGLIYNLRSVDRKTGKAPSAKKGGTLITSGSPKTSNLEATLIDAVVDLGGTTVQELLRAAIARVKANAKK